MHGGYHRCPRWGEVRLCWLQFGSIHQYHLFCLSGHRKCEAPFWGSSVAIILYLQASDPGGAGGRSMPPNTRSRRNDRGSD